MAKVKDVNWARIHVYGDIMIPVSKLDDFLDDCVVVKTSYSGDTDAISEITKIERIYLHTDKELEAALVQANLEGKT